MGDADREVIGGGPPSLVPRLLEVGRADPERIVLRFHDGARWSSAVSHGGLAGRVSFARRRLGSLGLRPGDRVVLALDVSPEAVFAFLGAVSAGVIPALTPPWAGGLGLGDAWLARVADDAGRIGARAVLVQRGLEEPVRSRGLCVAPGDMVLGSDPHPLAPVERGGDDVCLLQWTSGSTGRPRAVRVTHANVLANARAVQERAAFRADDVMLSWLPLHHDMGLQGGLLQVPLAGGEACLMSPRFFLRRPLSWMEALSDRGATLSLGPSFGYALAGRALAAASAGALSLARVRMLFNGGEPIDSTAVEAFLGAAAPHGLAPSAMAPSYGLGECTLAVTMSRPGEGMRLAAGSAGTPVVSCGAPMADTTLELCDDAGRAVPAGGTGEIVVAGPSVCPGYDGEHDRTVFRDGRLFTGDLGFLRGGGLHVVGRRKDVLIVRGVKVAAADVERAAERDGSVLPGRAVAFSIPDPHEGTERAVLLVRVASGAADRPALARRIRARVLEATGLEVDLRFVGAGQIPRTTSGKLRRAEARARFLEGCTP